MTKTALILAGVFILCCAPAQYLGHQNDDLFYYLGSRAILEGHYRLMTSPGFPPLIDVSPGLPLLLVPASWLSGEWYLGVQIFCALMAALLPGLLWLWLRRSLPEPAAVLVSVLYGLSPPLLAQSGCLMPEPVYTVFVLLLLLQYSRKQGASRPAFIGALMAFLTLLRTAALSAFPAVLARVLILRRWKEAIWIMAPPAAVIVGWSWWCGRNAGGVMDVNALRISFEGGSLTLLPGVLLDNLRYYLGSWGSFYLPRPPDHDGPAVLLGLGLASASLRGAWLLWRRDRCDEGVLLLAGGVFMHAVWPWHYSRYLIPLLPWVLWTLAVGLGRHAKTILAILLACQTGFQSWRWLGLNPQPDLAGTYAWLRGQGAGEAMASLVYVRDGFYCAKPSLQLPYDRPGFLVPILSSQGVRFVLWQDSADVGLSAQARSVIGRQLQAAGEELKHSRKFHLIHENRLERTKVYELRR